MHRCASARSVDCINKLKFNEIGAVKMNNREKMLPFYAEYVINGGVVSPMNTESCRRYLQQRLGDEVEPEDVLWLFYHYVKE